MSAQILVSFSHHQLFFPAASESELRKNLRQRMLMFLATAGAGAHQRTARPGAGTLEEQRRQLQAQLRALRGHAQGLHPLLSATDTDEHRLATLEQRLAQDRGELVVARKQLGTLDDYLEQVRQVLSQPETYLCNSIR
jgi:DNA repair exonuclease SbcCD ATPase subunit